MKHKARYILPGYYFQKTIFAYTLILNGMFYFSFSFLDIKQSISEMHLQSIPRMMRFDGISVANDWLVHRKLLSKLPCTSTAY